MTLQIKNEKLLEHIAAVLKDLRIEKNVTQIDVYNETKIHIGRVETASANVSISTLEMLCKYYGIKLSTFFKRVEDLSR